MITSFGYDRGSIEFARSKGIGLWRFIPQGKLVCLIENSCEVQDSDILCALTTCSGTEAYLPPGITARSI